jgi:hypothetical protein
MREHSIFSCRIKCCGSLSVGSKVPMFTFRSGVSACHRWDGSIPHGVNGNLCPVVWLTGAVRIVDRPEREGHDDLLYPGKSGSAVPRLRPRWSLPRHRHPLIDRLAGRWLSAGVAGRRTQVPLHHRRVQVGGVLPGSGQARSAITPVSQSRREIDPSSRQMKIMSWWRTDRSFDSRSRRCGRRSLRRVR